MKLPDHLKLFISGTIVSIIGNIFLGLVNYLIRRVMANTLSQTEYGCFYSVFALISIIVAIFEFGLVNAGTVLIAENPRQKSECFSFLLILKVCAGIVICGTLFLFHSQIAENFLLGNGKSVLMIMAVYALFVSFQGAFVAFFQGSKAYSPLSIFRCLILGFVFVLICICTETSGAKGAAWAYALGYGIFVPIQFLWICKYKGVRITFAIPRDILNNIFKLIGIVAFISFMHTLLFHMDSVMLTKIRGVDENAVYNIALPVTQLLLSFMVFSSVFIPLATDMVKASQYQRLNKYVTGTIAAVLVCTPVLYFLVSFMGKWVIDLLFSTAYSGQAAPVLPWLFCGYFLYSAGAFVMQILIVMRCNKELYATVFLTVTANFFLNWLFIKNHGAVGAAQATFYSYLFFFFIIISVFFYHSKQHICRKN